MEASGEINLIERALTDAFSLRRERNARYTLRAFARDLGISSGRLSNLLKGKEGLSASGAKAIAGRLGLARDESREFTLFAESRWGRAHLTRETARRKLNEFNTRRSKRRTLDDEAFRVISQWHHLALLELTRTKNFDPDPKKIAKRLGITVTEVHSAIRSLKNLGLLTDERSSLRLTNNVLVNPLGLPSGAVRSFHKQMISRALRAVEEQTTLKRELSSLTIAFDAEQLNAARSLISEFKQKFSERFGEMASPRSVYALNIQFFELEENPPREGSSDHVQV